MVLFQLLRPSRPPAPRQRPVPVPVQPAAARWPACPVNAALVPAGRQALVTLHAGAGGLAAGLDAAAAHLAGAGAASVDVLARDGAGVEAGTLLMRAHGDGRTLLPALEPARALAATLSGLATRAADLSRALADGPTRLAVRLARDEDETGEIARALTAGGALIDPHDPATCVVLHPWHAAAAGGPGRAVRTAREAGGPFRRIEVEVRDTAQALEALAAGADGLIARIDDAPALRAVAPRLVIEGVADPARLPELAATGAAWLRLGLADLGAAALPVTADAALR